MTAADTPGVEATVTLTHDGRTVSVRVLEADVATLASPNVAWNVVNAAATAAHLALEGTQGPGEHDQEPEDGWQPVTAPQQANGTPPDPRRAARR